MNKKKLIIAIILSYLAGVIGSFFTKTGSGSWYENLVKPSFNPPGYLFGPVWLTLYTLIGISLYLVWDEKYTDTTFILFLIQWVLNAVWSILFFGIENMKLAFIDIWLLIFSIILMIKYYYARNKISSYLLIPYLMWVCFAMILNYNFILLN